MKIGLCGGTYDPIHTGHMIMGEETGDVLGLQSILYIPAKLPPHKRDMKITPSEHRLAMVQLAVRNHKIFSASDLELKREGPSFTVQTLEYFRKTCPDDDFLFVMGQDAFIEIETWHRFEDVFDLCRLVIVTRPGSPLVEPRLFTSAVRRFFPDDVVFLEGSPDTDRNRLQTNWRLCFLPIPALHISSSDIRRRIREGRSIRYLVPGSVRRYIRNNNLYKD
jgi:nicotinate-nucleotide adenylyltransferase